MFLTYYYKRIILYDFLNKFKYTNINQMPNIKKIVLYFNYKKIDFKTLLLSSMALELLTFQKSIIIKSKKINIKLKFKIGSPVGCKITIRKKNIDIFFLKLLTNDILNKNLYITKISNEKLTLNLKITNVLKFAELEKHYNMFKKLSSLNITIITNSNTNKELIFLILSHKIKDCKCNSIGRV